MNNFKEMIKINSKRNVDEIIYSSFIVGMRQLKRKLEESEGQDNKEEILQIENRIKCLSAIFLDFEGNMEIIEDYDRRKYLYERPERKNNSVDIELQKIIEKSGNKIYKAVIGDGEKVQVLDRIIRVYKLLNSFDEYMEALTEKKTRANTITEEGR